MLAHIQNDHDRPINGTPSGPRGFVAFVTEHRTALVRYATLLTGSISSAEDLVHDVLVRMLPRWERLDEPLPYVRRAITNDFLSWRRRWSTRNIHFIDPQGLNHVVDPDVDPRPDPQIWALLLSLSRAQRTALVLRYYEGLDDAEIATVLACRPATVRSHVSRGIATIRTALYTARQKEHDDEQHS